MALYRLASHVRIATLNDGLMFLDLRKNRYFGVGQGHGASIQAALTQGSDGRTSGEQLHDENDRGVPQSLIDAGLLVQRTEADPAPLPRPMPPVATDAIDFSGLEKLPPSISLLHVLAFIRSVLVARRRFKTLSLEQLFRVLDSRNVKTVAIESCNVVAKLNDLLSIFRRLCVLTVTMRDACVVEALALVEFASRFNIPLSLLIGVRERPFMAHCWCQYGTFVINDSRERISQYVVIATT